MKIIELKSSNIKRLKAIELKLDEANNVVVVSGKNGAGKTSVLDSIWFALGGAKVLQDKPIREGEDHAEIELDLGDYIVTRSFTEKGTYLKVENKEGAKFSNPQQLLDTLIGKLSFDPLEFARMDSKKQVTSLIDVVGVDFSDLNTKQEEASKERLVIGREIKGMGEVAEQELADAKLAMNVPKISIAELSTQLETAIKAENEFNQQVTRYKDNQARIKILETELTNLNDEQKKLAGIEKPTVNSAELRIKLLGAEQENSKITAAESLILSASKIAAAKSNYQALEDLLSAIAKQRAERLASAKMPIEGLSWNDEAVLYKDIPFAQLSAAEQLKVSMAIAMVSNPTLRVILIRDGSLLDSDNLKVIHDMAKDLDFQVFVECVDESGKVGVYIEEGEIRVNNYK